MTRLPLPAVTHRGSWTTYRFELTSFQYDVPDVRLTDAALEYGGRWADKPYRWREMWSGRLFADVRVWK